MVLMVAPLYIQAQNVKLGKVDKLEIYNCMPEKAQAETMIRELSDKYQEEFKMLQNEYNRKYADFQALALDTKTPGTIKERRMQELQENNEKIEVFMKEVASDLKKKEEELVGPLKKKVEDAIREIGDEQGFWVIYDINEPGVAYLGSCFEDVTSLVKLHLGLPLNAPTQPQQ